MSVTFAWGDLERARYGLARFGDASLLAVAFRGPDAVAAFAEGGIDVADAPLRADEWRVSGALDGAAVDLSFEPVSSPIAIPEAGLTEQLCRVHGSVDGEALDGLGQRTVTEGDLDWERIELVRTLGVWLGEGAGGLTLTSVRPSGASSHADEAVRAALLSEHGDPIPVDDPRLSTTYDGDGHQRRAGLELWVSDDDPYPQRIAGEVLAGSSLDLGALRLDCAFMRWHSDGREGIGRYDILRRA